MTSQPGHSNEIRWFCIGCWEYTEHAPCEHCGAGHDAIVVIDADREPPTTDAEADHLPTVEDFEWPPEAYR